ncbi:MAG: hypothetical protein L0Y66_05400 [Myxococcaceae bacterium]|nr:hypothetical protein [Myxococcaceae bacterium]
MAHSNDQSPDRVRFGRSQKFRLSSKGSEATASYSVMIEAARAGSGRGQFDAARDAWSAPRGLEAADGLYLVEFGSREQTIQEATRSLEVCGTTPKEVKAAVGRLLACGMLEPVPAPPPPPPPQRYRW